ncbi:hypothetical protein OIY81_3556 [Cryptosporidium canis]|nr:hypothetical protein OIY81_3556 [Cryptosporidium canis]
MGPKIKNPQNTLKCCFEWFKTFKIVENGDVSCDDIFEVLVPSNLLLFIQELSPMFFADYALTEEHKVEMAKGLHFLMDGINDYMDGRFRDEIDTLDYDLIASAIEKKGKVQNEILCEVCRVCGFVIVFAVESEYNEDVISNMMILSEDAQIELQHMIQITGEFAEEDEGEKDELQQQLSKLKQQQEKIQKELGIKQEQVRVLLKLLDENGVSIAGKVDINLEEVESFPTPGTESFYITQLSILTEQLNMQKQLLLSEQKRIQLLESQGIRAAGEDSAAHGDGASGGDAATISTLKQQIMIREQEAELHLSAKKEIEKRSQMELKLLSTCLHDMALKYHQCKSIIKQLDEELSSLKQKCQISINATDQDSGLYKDETGGSSEVPFTGNIN